MSSTLFKYTAAAVLRKSWKYHPSFNSGYEHNLPKSLLGLVPRGTGLSCREIWGWLNSIFNRVDDQRILDAGPDRACAEWLLRCGAGVKWVNSEQWTRDYNSLPLTGNKDFYRVAEVDATDSAIMYIGFPHFNNCKYIRKMVIHKATYIDDEALNYMHLLKRSLEELQISSCGNVSPEGLKHLKCLKNLQHLMLYDLPLVKDKEAVISSLQESLRNCTIEFPYAQASEIKEENS